MSISFGHLLFAFSGRINRAKWWLTVLVVFVMEIVVDILHRVMPVFDGNVVLFLGFLAAIAAIWISLAAGAKRLHDIGRTGAWLVMFFGAPLLLILAFIVDVVITIGAEALASMNDDEMYRRFADPALWQSIGLVALVVGILLLVLVIWQLIWFGCLRGTPGPNQFGPDPLGPAPLDQQGYPGYPLQR
jgi:uncharacterized membrane protein YhaH (DUF805 family)